MGPDERECRSRTGHFVAHGSALVSGSGGNAAKRPGTIGKAKARPLSQISGAREHHARMGQEDWSSIYRTYTYLVAKYYLSRDTPQPLHPRWEFECRACSPYPPNHQQNRQSIGPQAATHLADQKRALLILAENRRGIQYFDWRAFGENLLEACPTPLLPPPVLIYCCYFAKIMLTIQSIVPKIQSIGFGAIPGALTQSTAKVFLRKRNVKPRNVQPRRHHASRANRPQAGCARTYLWRPIVPQLDSG